MGKLVIFTGPMGSGKTTKLLEKYKECKNISNKCILFKPTIDTRYGCYTKTRDGKEQICNTIDKLDELLRFSFICDYFFIDEFQFLGGSLQTILKLLDKNKEIYISGLSLTSEREPFGLMGNLMCFADEVNFLDMKCQNCKKEDAKYTYYKPSNKEHEIVLGDKEYISVCSNCYIELNKNRLNVV